MRSVLTFAAVALTTAATAVAVPRLSDGMEGFYDRVQEMMAAAPAARTTPVTPATQRDSSDTAANNRNMTIQRGANGHFNVEAEVDGRRMNFLIDTGASVIALRESDAARLGIHPARREYTAQVSTANGVVRAAPAELNRVEVGSLTVRNVQALVLPDEVLGQNLLGMSFLSRVRWEHRDGRLVLEQ